MLSSEKEQELIALVAKGRETRRLLQAGSAYCLADLLDLLSEEHLKELREEVARGLAAMHALVAENQGLVKKIARRALAGRSFLPVVFDDLVQEGKIGFMEAVNRFDPSFGAKLCTYAGHWIKMAVHLALKNCAKGGLIRIPLYLVDALPKYQKAVLGLSEQLRRRPTAKEIARATGIPLLRVESLEALPNAVQSIYRRYSDDPDDPIDWIEDTRQSEPASRNTDGLRTALDQLLAKLSPQNRKIVEMKYGWSGPVLSVEEIAHKMGMGRALVRQKLNRALRALHLLGSKQSLLLTEVRTSS